MRFRNLVASLILLIGFLSVPFIASCYIFFGKSNNYEPELPEPPEESEEPEEILEPADDYFLDLKKISLTSAHDDIPGDYYDKESFILYIGNQWRIAQIWLGDFDASLYRYLRIEYEPVSRETNLPFRFLCRYADNPNQHQLCERKRTVQYITLDK